MAHQIDTDVKVRGETVVGFGHNKIVRVSGGRLYTAHITDVDDVEVHYSDNDGVSWTLDTTFSETSAYYITMCVSELGDVFVSYCIGSGTGWTLKVKKRDYSSGTWSEILSESVTSNFSGQKPQLVIVYNQSINRLHAVWHYNKTNDDIVIMNKYSDNRGTSWTSGTEKGLYTWSYNMLNALYGVDTNPTTGKIYIYWRQAEYGSRNYLERFTSIGVWEARESAQTTGTGTGGSFLIDGNGNIWMFTQSSVLNVLKNGIQQWSTTAGYAKDGMLAIGEDVNGNIFIIYTKDSDGKLYKRSSQDTFVAETALTTGAGDRPSCEQHSLGSSDELHYVYSSNA